MPAEFQYATGTYNSLLYKDSHTPKLAAKRSANSLHILFTFPSHSLHIQIGFNSDSLQIQFRLNLGSVQIKII
ncbi:hypothetical protein VN97_g13014 [Penicillium thymicola]|uniref:Uncharacterized protein n=1 Tax=Penicillium thymicola TaxID=293382 RepID=A0AAI9T4J0_PENTH|nr:hypothetical protein VN97_g13014 [Penicillium thymicola]